MSALMLRLLACLCMLLDHIGYVWDVDVLRAVGRLAFPIFVFLIYNGYLHTSDRRRYALRLGLFALISQIPYCLLDGYENWLEKGNVFVSLLMALLCLWAVDAMCKCGKLRFFCWLPPVVLYLCYHYGWLNSDYDIKGVLFVLVFYFIERRSLWGKLLTVLGMLAAVNYSFFLELGVSLLRGMETIPAMRPWELLQNWSLLAAVPIFLYNGEKGHTGRHPKLVQYGFYWFYPAHQLVLWAMEKWIG